MERNFSPVVAAKTGRRPAGQPKNEEERTKCMAVVHFTHLETKEEIKEAASLRGISLSSFIEQAVDFACDRLDPTKA